MQPVNRFSIGLFGVILQNEPAYGPNSVQFRLAINQMLKIGRDLEVRDQTSQRLRRQIRYRHDVRRIRATVHSHGRTAKSTSGRPNRFVARRWSENRPEAMYLNASSTDS